MQLNGSGQTRLEVMKFSPTAKPTVGLCLKHTEVLETKRISIMSQYLKRLTQYGYETPGNDILVIPLEYPMGNLTKAFMIPVVKELLEQCSIQGIETLYVGDSKYFQYLSGQKKTEEFIGEAFPCVIKGYENIMILPGMNHQILTFNPNKLSVLEDSLKALTKYVKGTLAEVTELEIAEVYPVGLASVKAELNRLKAYDKIAVDIETRGDMDGDALRFDRGYLSTISFSTDDKSGTSFPVDKYWFQSITSETQKVELEQNLKVELKSFFDEVLSDETKKIYFHNGLFDAKFLIRSLYMTSDDDYQGMYEGIKKFSNIEDTMIMVYLCTNSTVKEEKGLKAVSKEYIGNYAIDVKDITKHPLNVVLKYNIQDTVATYWVATKYEELLVQEKQDEVYREMFKPSFAFLLEMMMTGLPISPTKVEEVQQGFAELKDQATEVIHKSTLIRRVQSILAYNAMEKYNSSHVKQKGVDEFDIEFNAASVIHMRILLFDVLNLEVLDTTGTGAPAVGSAIVKQYLAEAKYNEDTDTAELLSAILDYVKAQKMLGTFIKAFQELTVSLTDGTSWLRGNLNLGGTASGRLSSSSPNLQNLPSGGKEGELIKSCIVAPDGWLLGGADFNALEDRIGAILSKDKNKTLEFSAGLDGHALRSLAFFPEELPAIDMTDVAAVNSIKDLYPDIRQKAKAPSFALQYGGTWSTIKQNLGCTSAKAKSIEENYHKLYPGLAAFSKKMQQHGMRHGYVPCAFGLKLRTPLLKAKGEGLYVEEYLVESEGRSAANAATQSYGQLMNRALITFRKVIEESNYRDKIRLVNTIHDAAYMVIKAEPKVIKFVNDELIKAMEWQEDAIASQEVKLGAELDIGKSWDTQITLKNNLSLAEIQEFMTEHKLEVE